VIGISQDDQAATNQFRQQLATAFPVHRDSGLALSRGLDLTFVPSLGLLCY
jgi:peroxiredoxin